MSTGKAVLVGGGIGATLDMIYACVRNGGYGYSPEWVMQSVASGWLGKAAFDGGWPAAMLGLASHYSILFVAAWFYLQASRRVPVLATQAVACGTMFGAGIYLFMNFVVLPLSAFPFHPSYPWLKLVEGFATHGLFVGVPIATAVRRFAPS